VQHPGKKVLSANWKAKLSRDEAEQLCLSYKEHLLQTGTIEGLDLILFPSALHLELVSRHFKDSPILLGAQNIHWESKGAYTGEICAEQLLDYGVTHVILGHSERREYFQESYDIVHRKLKMAVQVGLTPILCLGESAEEREAGITEMVIVDQIEAALGDIKAQDIREMLITYEPIWAIGSGKPVPVAESEHVLEMLRRVIDKHFHLDSQRETDIRLLYGGSVNVDQAREYMASPILDGLLIGKASLTGDKFSRIAACAAGC
jgi:triosephosphate isomerase